MRHWTTYCVSSSAFGMRGDYFSWLSPTETDLESFCVHTDDGRSAMLYESERWRTTVDPITRKTALVGVSFQRNRHHVNLLKPGPLKCSHR
jgi:hypothetical protein